MTASVPGDVQDSRVKVLSEAESAQSLKPLAVASAPAPGAAAPRGITGCEPRVSVQREGDRVMSISIQCTCGQVVDLACLYQEAEGKS